VILLKSDFVFGKFLYQEIMTINLKLFFYKLKRPSKDDVNEILHTRSKKLKQAIFFTYNMSILCSFYFYIRHNTYCEPYVYSFFSVCEYVIVLTNIAFHMTIISDLSLRDKKSFKISIIELKRR
jgi:post-GPI attachment to proteins factor 2